MIHKLRFVVPLGVVTLVATTAFADFADDNLQTTLKEIRDLRAQMRRLEIKVDSILRRLGRIEKELPGQSGTDATKSDERSKRHAFPRVESADPVDEVLRLQFESPDRLLDGLHEREERLRRRVFPAEIDLRN